MKTLILTLLLLSAGCSKTIDSQKVNEKSFPTVSAESLEGEQVTIPARFSGEKVVLLVGYTQRSQFDIDRWILGLKQLETPVAIAELPTISGMVPSIISETINNGMRSGIPQEEWKGVFTVYDDADKIAEFLGNEKPNIARVVLLNEQGQVQWFYDRGYSADRAIELDKLIRD